MKKFLLWLTLLSVFVLCFFFMNTSILAFPGVQLNYHDNAPLGPLESEQPDGYQANDREWRLIYLNDKASFTMPRYPALWSFYGYSKLMEKDKYYFDQSLQEWKDALPGVSSLDWSDDLFINNQKLSSIWQKYGQTLYYQINNQTVTQPLEDDFLF